MPKSRILFSLMVAFGFITINSSTVLAEWISGKWSIPYQKGQDYYSMKARGNSYILKYNPSSGLAVTNTGQVIHVPRIKMGHAVNVPPYSSQAAPKKPRISIILDDQLLKSIDDFRYENRIPTRAEAIRRLLEEALKR